MSVLHKGDGSYLWAVGSGVVFPSFFRLAVFLNFSMCVLKGKSSNKCYRLYSCHPVPQSLRDLRARAASRGSSSQRRPTLCSSLRLPWNHLCSVTRLQAAGRKQAPLCPTSASSQPAMPCMLQHCDFLSLQVLNKSSVTEPEPNTFILVTSPILCGWDGAQGAGGRNKSLWAPPVSPPSRCGRREPRLE